MNSSRIRITIHIHTLESFLAGYFINSTTKEWS